MNQTELQRKQRATLTAAAGAALVLAATAACGGSSQGAQHPHADGAPGEEPAIAVRVAAVTRDSITSLYSTSATLRADRRATVIARTRGVIQRLLVEEGDTVTATQPLAELENDEQRIAADRARTTRDTSRREMQRLEGLYDRGLVSEDEYERSRRDAADAEHALDLAELELSRTVVRAPFAGVILQRHLDVGATVSDGTPVYDIADLDPLYADINIPERHVTRLRPGQKVELTADSTGASAWASIERIAPLVDAATGTVKVTVAVEGSAALRPGAFVRVDIITDTHIDALVVERSALVAEGRRWNLYRLNLDGETVEQLEVRLGYENSHRVEVAGVVDEAKSLAPGETVVVTGAPALSEGARVRVIVDEEEGSSEAGHAS